MLFGRRTPADWREKIRIALWPRRNWSRSVKYIAHRVLRLTASPHAIAAGVAAGVFASFTPYLGFHFLIAWTVAYFIAGNFIAAALGTFFGNPLTFPFIWGSTYASGRFILSGASHSGNGGHSQLAEIARSGFFEHGFTGVIERLSGIWEPVLKPMTVGCIPLGVLFAIIAYVVTRWVAIAFRTARQRKLAQKALLLQQSAAEKARQGVANAAKAANLHGKQETAS